MAGTIYLGMLLAVVATASNNLGKGLQKQGTRALPGTPRGWRAVWACRTSRVFLAGMAVDLAGALLTVPALALAPVSLVQPLLTAGMAILVIFAHVRLGERMDRGCRLGVWLCILGAVGVAATASEPGGQPGRTQMLALLAATGAVLAVLELVRRTGRMPEPTAGLQAGACFGLSVVVLRAVLSTVGWQSHWPLLVLGLGGSAVFTAAGFFFQTRGLLTGRAALVGTYAGSTALMWAVTAGPLALGESLPASAGARAVRLTSYALVAAGAVMMSRRGITPRA